MTRKTAHYGGSSRKFQRQNRIHKSSHSKFSTLPPIVACVHLREGTGEYPLGPLQLHVCGQAVSVLIKSEMETGRVTDRVEIF